jgi:hypothetical protein
MTAPFSAISENTRWIPSLCTENKIEGLFEIQTAPTIKRKTTLATVWFFQPGIPLSFQNKIIFATVPEQDGYETQAHQKYSYTKKKVHRN